MNENVNAETNISLLEQNEENSKAKNQKQTNKIKKGKFKKFYGLFIALLSAVFLSLSSTLIKKVEIFSGSDQAIVRYVFQLLILIVIARLKGLNIFGQPEQRKLLLLRGIFGAIGFISFIFSVKLINPSDSAALLNTKIIIIAVLARVFLKEKFTILHFISLALTILGVLMISQPSFLTKHFGGSKNISTIKNYTNYTISTDVGDDNEVKLYIGILFGLMASISSSLVSIFLKKLTNNKVHYSVSILFTSYIGLPASLVISLLLHFLWKKDNSFNSFIDTCDLMWQIIYSILSSVCGVLSQITFAVSLQYDDTTHVTIVRSTDLFFTFLLQYLFLSITANVFSTTGAVLIFSSTILIILMKLIEQKLDKISSLDCLKKFIFYKL